MFYTVNIAPTVNVLHVLYVLHKCASYMCFMCLICPWTHRWPAGPCFTDRTNQPKLTDS